MLIKAVMTTALAIVRMMCCCDCDDFPKWVFASLLVHS